MVDRRSKRVKAQREKQRRIDNLNPVWTTRRKVTKPRSKDSLKGPTKQLNAPSRRIAAPINADASSAADSASHDDPGTMADTEEETPAESGPFPQVEASEDDQDFLATLVSIILDTRFLRQRRAARDTCLKEQSDLRELVEFTEPQVAGVPAGDEYRAIYDKFRDNLRRYERHLEERVELEQKLDREIEDAAKRVESKKQRLSFESKTAPALECLEDDVAFGGAYRRCHSTFSSLKDVDQDMETIDQDRKAIHDRLDSHHRRILADGLRDIAPRFAPRNADVPEAEVTDHSPEEDLEILQRLMGTKQQFEGERNQAKHSHSIQIDVLAGSAESALVQAGVLSLDPISEVPQQEVDKDKDNEVTATPEQPAEDTDTTPTQPPERNRLRAELLGAQEDFRNARLAWENGRMHTDEELAAFPQSMSENDKGAHLFLKFSRITRSYIDAEERLKLARQAAREANLTDRYPTDQTWDFEDRTLDGYLPSYHVKKLNKALPGIERWLPELPDHDRSPPPGNPTPPKSVPDMDLESLGMGEDYMNVLPSAMQRERIDNHRRACEEIREKESLPEASGDPLIVEPG